MIIIEYDKKVMWKLFKKEFIENNWKINDICQELNIHKGTINRWIKKKEVPPQYFNDFNRILSNKYSLKIDEKEKFKVMGQFFTPIEEAKKLVDLSLAFISENWKIDLNQYTLIEPSAGDGAFYNNFPNNYEKIGIDIDPKSKNIKKQDWFKYYPKSSKNIVIGNPPFGLRGQLALKFINKASDFSDFICFILPPLFNSNGKGSPRLRVNKDFYLAKEVKINSNFKYPSGENVKVNSLFQIWTKKISSKIKPISIPNKTSEWIKVYSLSNGKTPSSKRNIQMINKCDYYLPSTTFNEILGYNSFYDLPNRRGYGIVIKKNKERIMKILKDIKWEKYAFKSTNGANNLRIQLIIDSVERNI